MVKTPWQTVRLGMFAVLFVGVMAAVIRAFLVPPTPEDKTLVNALEFPNSVPLNQWKLSEDNFPQLEGESYQYQYINQNNQPLEIKTSYRQYDGGNVSRLLFKEAEIPPATVAIEIRKKEGIGSYGVFEYQDKAYLTGCINRLGESTVTDAQHTQNKYKYGWGIQRTLLWVVGYKDLFETACLWTVMSTPTTSALDAVALNKTYENLETVWAEWYGWWKPRLETEELQ